MLDGRSVPARRFVAFFRIALNESRSVVARSQIGSRFNRRAFGNRSRRVATAEIHQMIQSSPTRRGISRPGLQAINDLPIFNRPYGTNDEQTPFSSLCRPSCISLNLLLTLQGLEIKSDLIRRPARAMAASDLPQTGMPANGGLWHEDVLSLRWLSWRLWGRLRARKRPRKVGPKSALSLAAAARGEWPISAFSNGSKNIASP